MEKDPWRLQYFEGVVCPDDIIIPTDDGDAYRLYPLHRQAIIATHLLASRQG